MRKSIVDGDPALVVDLEGSEGGQALPSAQYRERPDSRMADMVLWGETSGSSSTAPCEQKGIRQEELLFACRATGVLKCAEIVGAEEHVPLPLKALLQ